MEVAGDSQALTSWVALAISVVALIVSIAATLVPYWRRPSLSLQEDPERAHSRVEGDGLPYLRLLVRNARRKRSAKAARVVLDGYRPARAASPLTRLGSPFLAWPSTFGQDSDSYVSVIFSDAARPVGLGRFARVRLDADGRRAREARWAIGLAPPEPGPIRHFPEADDASDARWHVHLELAHGVMITDERDWLPPGRWTIRLIVGADDGDAQAYEVDLAWSGDEADAEAVLGAALDRLAVRPAR